MEVRRLSIGVSVVLAVAGASAAFGAADPGNSSGSVSGSRLNTPELFSILAGEFQGDLQKLGPDGKLMKAEASSSNKLEQNGRRVTSCFESTLNGSPVDGAVVWQSPTNGKASTSWTCDSQSCQGSGQMQAREMTFSGQPLGGASGNAKIEQTVSVFNANHYQVYWNRIEPNGQKTLVMHLDMMRMAEGRQSAAASKFETSTAVASAKSAMESTQRHASADGQ